MRDRVCDMRGGFRSLATSVTSCGGWVRVRDSERCVREGVCGRGFE